MKIICSKNSLLKSVSISLKAVPSKTTMPILECILIDATTNQIKFTTNDMELGIETIVEGTIEEKGMIALDAKILYEIIRRLPDNDVTIKTDDKLTAVITCEKAKFTIPGKSGEDFAYLPIIEREECLTVSQFTLKEMIRQTIFSIAANETNKLMTGELFDLKTVPGMDTRPTTDRIKETLFNILQPQLLDCRFLDLFSGSGGIGIEALSRGASYAVLVEKNPKACSCIRENLAFTKLAEHGKLLNMDVLQALRSLEGKGAFDIIFMDPPYNQELERQVLEYLRDSTVADENTLIIVEADLHTDFAYLESLGYRQLRSKEYKTNKHVFLERV